MALGLGFTQDEISRSTADSLGNAVALMQRRGVQQQAPATPPAPPDPKQLLGITEEEEEEFGPVAMGVLTRMATENAKNKQELEARLAQYEQREQVRSRDQMATTLETAVGGLGDEYSAVLGKGTLPELMKTNYDAYRRRHWVLTNLQREGVDFLSAPVEVIRQKLREQVERDFPGMVKPGTPAAPNPAEMAKPRFTAEEWAKSGSPPPTQRTGGNELPARQGGDIEDRHRGAITDEEVADEQIRKSLRRRQQTGSLT